MQTFHCEPQITANFTQQITAHDVPEQWKMPLSFFIGGNSNSSFYFYANLLENDNFLSDLIFRRTDSISQILFNFK